MLISRQIPGKRYRIPMMQRTDELATYRYAEDNSFQMLSMPYEHSSGKELSMTVLLPKGNNLTTTESAITCNRIIRTAEECNVPACDGLFPEVYP